MSFTYSLARSCARLTKTILVKVAHRNASQLPGRVAMSIDRDFLSHAQAYIKEGSVVVCGTNGKTTTTNLIANAFERAGKTVACNRAGANMQAGVAAALLDVSAHACDWAILEADELSCAHIVPALKPTYLVLLNLFRDQLDRAGEIDHVQDVLTEALVASPHTTLVVCADDPLSWGVALRARAKGTRVVTFGINEDLHLMGDRVQEARFCQVCGEPLEYLWHTYAQLGYYKCPQGDFERPALDAAATDVVLDTDGVHFDACYQGHDVYKLNTQLPGLYLVYNLMAAFTICELCLISPAILQACVADFNPQNGRLQKFKVAGREVILNLAKNPTGFNQNLLLLNQDNREKLVWIAINDNFNDGKDVSWLWDVDFERLASARCARVYCGGLRAHDMQVRLKYAGISAEVVPTMQELLAMLVNKQVLQAEQPASSTPPTPPTSPTQPKPSVPTTQGEGSDNALPLYALTNYSALWPAKAALESAGEVL